MAGNKTNSPHQSSLVMLRQEKKEEGHKSPEEMKKVVMNGAKLLCPFHPAPGTLLVTSNQIRLQGNIWATEADNQKINFLFLGICTHPSVASAPPPCISIITPLKWTDVGTVKVQDNKTLLKKSKIKCAISGQDITIIHDGQTVVPSVMMDIGQDVAKTASDFNCPPNVRDTLQNDVEKKCHGNNGERRACKGGDPCEILLIKIQKFKACAEARLIIMEVCYNGGDDGHKHQYNSELKGLTTCNNYYNTKCKKQEQKIPEPVTVPVHAPQQNEDFLKKMEILTGLTGAALILYLIISEGSRLFPPRNLIPIP
jgi:hypothetical protein